MTPALPEVIPVIIDSTEFEFWRTEHIDKTVDNDEAICGFTDMFISMSL
jgi:hypothetical protein